MRVMGARFRTVEGQRIVEMRDPDDNAHARYQYRRQGSGVERRVLSAVREIVTPWEPLDRMSPLAADLSEWLARPYRQAKNLDGRGHRLVMVYPMRPCDPVDPAIPEYVEYWPAVTNVPCPANCAGTVRWAEAGYVPGYRICDACGRHWLASGNATDPTLTRVGRRRSRVLEDGYLV
jgi:hypothetical protein